MKLENQTILIVSNEPWGDIWYSKHNWAFELSKKNTVFFIDPPKKWAISNLWSFKIKTRKYSDNLFILNYQNILSLTRYHFFYKLNNFFVSKRIKIWLKKNNHPNYIFWTFDPYRFSNPKLLSPKFSVYFIADKYDLKREITLIQNTDYFITVSKVLTDYLAIKNPLVLSHGISKSEFDCDSPIDIEDGYILYIGNIDYRLDCEFIKKLVEEFPEERFLFIGNITHLSLGNLFNELFIEQQHKNLIYHSAVHFKKLKNYINKSKACIAPMMLEVNGNNINHHKLLQYLAQGKPLLAAKFIDYNNNNIVYSYQTHEQGIELLKDILKGDEPKAKIDARIQFAQKYTYEHLIDNVEQYITKSQEIKNRIVLIVSNEPWGNIWFSKQHYANELAKMGNKVYFINPNNKWKFSNLFSFKTTIHKTDCENIVVVSTKNNFPQFYFKSILTRVNDFINCQKLNSIVNLDNPSLIWWKFEPFRYLSTFPYKSSKTIYHVVDPYTSFWQDQYQVKDADLIVCINQRYYDYYKKKKENVILIPHGISDEEFLLDEASVKLIKKQYGNFTILIGTIENDLDLDLLKQLALNNIKVVIIGREIIISKEWKELKTLPNIYYLGEIHAKKINNYISAAKAGLVAYTFNSSITDLGRTPLKTINYLAQNKPVVTSRRTTISTLESQAIYYASDTKEYISFVDKAMNNELFVNEVKVKDYLNDHSYPKLINKVLDQLDL